MHLKFLFLICFFYFEANVNAQIFVKKIPDENLCTIDFELMQAEYQIAFSNMTSEEYLFKGREEEWKNCWINLMKDLNIYMQSKGLKLESNHQCFNRIYFNKEGTITAYLYLLKGFSKEQEKKFDDNLFQFLIEQKLNINASQNYWQYGTLKFE